MTLPGRFVSSKTTRVVLVAVIVAALSAVFVALNAAAQPKGQLRFILSRDSVVAKPGVTGHYTLTVSRVDGQGSEPVTLNANGPGGWIITLDPSQTPSLALNEKAVVEVYFTPPLGEREGTYDLFFNGSTTSGLFTSAMMQVKIRPAVYWIWIAAGVVAIVIAAFAVVFVRASRRN